MPTTDWNPILRAEFDKAYWKELQGFVAQERAHHQVFPPTDEVFSALHLTPYADVRVLILGQDPYHGPGQAHGLCFSVRKGVAQPPSLVNILKELELSFQIHEANGSFLGGVHIELTGEDVTECTGGARGLTDADLARAYRSTVDPRLNYEQALELAMLIGRHGPKR